MIGNHGTPFMRKELESNEITSPFGEVLLPNWAGTAVGVGGRETVA
jgi:hypothetical protein